ncbi:hypothetical protein, partial [Streptomyces lavendulae]|uniref:acyl carrier protein n=1 Tax=Streptomyces lavendulae TaxID=1914 RepID=UPI0031EBBB12
MNPTEWRNRLGALPPTARYEALNEIMNRCAEVAGRRSAGFLDAHTPWRRSGIYREAAERFREALAEATGLKLPATLLFDHPSPHALAGHLVEELVGVRTQQAGPALHPSGPGDTEHDDPIAIVALGCRLPGGVESPAQLWKLVA